MGAASRHRLRLDTFRRLPPCAPRPLRMTLLLAILLLVGTWGLGRAVLSGLARFDPRVVPEGPGDGVLATVLGIATLSLVLFVLATTGLLRPGALVFVLCAGAAVTALHLRRHPPRRPALLAGLGPLHVMLV